MGIDTARILPNPLTPMLRAIVATLPRTSPITLPDDTPPHGSTLRIITSALITIAFEIVIPDMLIAMAIAVIPVITTHTTLIMVIFMAIDLITITLTDIIHAIITTAVTITTIAITTAGKKELGRSPPSLTIDLAQIIQNGTSLIFA